MNPMLFKCIYTYMWFRSLDKVNMLDEPVKKGQVVYSLSPPTPAPDKALGEISCSFRDCQNEYICLLPSGSLGIICECQMYFIIPCGVETGGFRPLGDVEGGYKSESVGGYK